MRDEITKHPMTTQEQFNQIVGLVLKNYKNEDYYFGSFVSVKTSPHTPPCNIYGIGIDPEGNIWLRTEEEGWNKLETTDRNYDVVVSSLYQRVTFELGHKKAA